VAEGEQRALSKVHREIAVGVDRTSIDGRGNCAILAGIPKVVAYDQQYPAKNPTDGAG
jgi:hypothetical protein